MKYTRREFLTTAITLATGCAAQQEQIFPFAPPYNKNIGYILLDLEKDAGFPTPTESYHKLGDLMDKARNRINETMTPQPTLEVIDAILNNSFTHSLKADTSLLGKSLSKGRCDIDCDITSYLYLSIGEAFRLPLQAVLAPQHMFVRWHFTPQDYINWETIPAGITYDSLISGGCDISDISIKKEVYLHSLSRQELIGVHLGSIATELLDQKKPAEALPLFEKALELHSRNFMATANKAMAIEKLKGTTEAMPYYQQALELDPNNTTLQKMLAKRHKKIKRQKKL